MAHFTIKQKQFNYTEHYQRTLISLYRTGTDNFEKNKLNARNFCTLSLKWFFQIRVLESSLRANAENYATMSWKTSTENVKSSNNYLAWIRAYENYEAWSMVFSQMLNWLVLYLRRGQSLSHDTNDIEHAIERRSRSSSLTNTETTDDQGIKCSSENTEIQKNRETL